MPAIAIVGCGAAGVSAFSALIDKLLASHLTNVTIDVYNKDDNFGPGMAYSTQVEKHRINMRAETMSIYPEKPNDFIQWMQENGHTEEYPARKIFGEYIKSRLAEKVTEARQVGIECNFYDDTVVDLTENKRNVTVKLTTDAEISYDNCLLCIGNYANSAYQALKDKEGYIDNPFDQKALSSFDKTASVLVLGTGLTAIDTCIALKENGHSGEIAMISRHGVLPKIRPPASDSYLLNVLTPENIRAEMHKKGGKLELDEMIALFREEFSRAHMTTEVFGAIEPLVSQSALTTLQQDYSRHKEYAKAFSVLKAIDDNAACIWNALPEEAQKQFDRQYKTLWYAYDYPMPPVTASYLMKEMEAGNIEIIKGIIDITHDPQTGKFVPGVSPHVQQCDYKKQSMAFDHVVNGMGIGVDIEKIADPLIQNGIKKGIFTPHPLGGIAICPENGSVVKKEGISEHIQLVGSLTRGNLFYVNSLEQTVQAAYSAVNHCVATIKKQSFQEKIKPSSAFPLDKKPFLYH